MATSVEQLRSGRDGPFLASVNPLLKNQIRMQLLCILCQYPSAQSRCYAKGGTSSRSMAVVECDYKTFPFLEISFNFSPLSISVTSILRTLRRSLYHLMEATLLR